MIDFNYYAPTRVLLGRGKEDEVPSLVREYGGSRVPRGAARNTRREVRTGKHARRRVHSANRTSPKGA